MVNCLERERACAIDRPAAPRRAACASAPAPAVRDERVERARLYAEGNFRRRLTVEELARVACLERKYFSARFKAELGAGPKEYLVALRLERAAALLLRSELTVGAIALSVGYGDQFAFSRAFRLRAGLCPSDFRTARRASGRPPPPGQTGAPKGAML